MRLSPHAWPPVASPSTSTNAWWTGTPKREVSDRVTGLRKDRGDAATGAAACTSVALKPAARSADSTCAAVTGVVAGRVETARSETFRTRIDRRLLSRRARRAAVSAGWAVSHATRVAASGGAVGTLSPPLESPKTTFPKDNVGAASATTNAPVERRGHRASGARQSRRRQLVDTATRHDDGLRSRRNAPRQIHGSRVGQRSSRSRW